ncbi:NAD-dependent epimerase/dehydratase family protein [Microbacterium lacticum]
MLRTRTGRGTTLTVAVVGGSGFLGRHVIAELARAGIRPIVLSRRGDSASRSAVEHWRCDVASEPSSVLESLTGCAAVINASSYVRDNEHLQARVNIDGVAQVVAAAAAAQMPLVHISTAGVYGSLPFVGGVEGDYALRPESSLSRTRARGDELAILGGATVLRPLFVSGAGDTHFLLPLLHMHAKLGAWVADGVARLSVAPAELVAAAAVAAAQRLLDGSPPALIHVVPDQPVTVRELLTNTLTEWGALPNRSVTVEEAIERLAPSGVPERKVRQFVRDYFISSTVLRGLIPDRLETLYPISPAAHAWYAAQRPAALPVPQPPTVSP